MPDTRPQWLVLHRPSPLQAVRQDMDLNGATWLFAWTAQSKTSWRWLHREARMEQHRLDAIDRGAAVTDDELANLCRAWDADVAEVRLTMG